MSESLEIKQAIKKKLAEKSKRWSFTAWEIPSSSKPELVSFLVYQREVTGKTLKSKFNAHYQGYVEFYKEYSQKQVKSLFKQTTMHVEVSLKSRELNMMYCLKPQSYYGMRHMDNPDCNETHHEENPQEMVLSWGQVKKLVGAEEE